MPVKVIVWPFVPVEVQAPVVSEHVNGKDHWRRPELAVAAAV